MKKICSIIFALFCVLNIYAENTITVASYNIRYMNDDDACKGNGWQQRAPVLTSLILFHGFEIFGTQEGLKNQLEDMKKALPGYEYIGIGRDDGKEKGEHSAIFYDTSKFKIEKNGSFWLSETPDVPSKGWDAVLPRICTWGLFKHIASGKKLLFFNLHMDHVGVNARVQSALLIEKKIKEMGEKLPVILTGDFNVDQTEISYKTIVTSGVLNDSHEKAAIVYGNDGTWNDFKPARYTDSRIDHIFVSNNITVLKWGVLTDTYRTKDASGNGYQIRIPSDHYPIMSVIKINK